MRLCVIVAACFLGLAVGTNAKPHMDCVLDDSGEVCTPSHGSKAQFNTRAEDECANNEHECLCMKAVEYTNEVRQRHSPGASVLKVGPMSQLKNAQRYAEYLSRLGSLKHQDLSDATQDVGCKRWIGGENIAYNYDINEAAKRCVEQWEESDGHLENIVRDWYTEVVVGFHFARDGRVFCVQTFGLVHEHGTFGHEDDHDCEAVSDDISQPSQDDDEQESDGEEEESDDDDDYGDRPQLPAPESPSPNSFPSGDFYEQFERNRKEGNRSCRCLEVGSKCWYSLRKLSGYRCLPWIPTAEQPSECKSKCCDYCKLFPANDQCTNSVVQSVCSAL